MSLYHVSAENTQGIIGEVQLSSGQLVKTSHPLGKEEGFNPEELIALAWSTCLNATVKAVLVEKGKGDTFSKVAVTVKLEKETSQNGFYFQIDGKVFISGMAQDEGESIMFEAHKRCPVSKLFSQSQTVSLTYLACLDSF